ncbi:MAG: hypothetical protein ACK5KU_05000, partial [Beutenbergiaceae bacterium]
MIATIRKGTRLTLAAALGLATVGLTAATASAGPVPMWGPGCPEQDVSASVSGVVVDPDGDPDAVDPGDSVM